MPPRIRLLQDADLPDCMRLKQAAGWNQTEADWRALLLCAPRGCLGIELDGRIVSTATAVPHDGVGWIGMVLTDPGQRGKGFATALLAEAIRYLTPLTETVKLDATAAGEPLYARLGFVAEAPIERWVSPGGVFEGAALEGRYEGTLRHAAIPMDVTAECSGAWAAGRAGSGAWYFGPGYGRCDADVERVARMLISGRGPAALDLFPTHSAAAIAERLGFTAARGLLRMVRGKARPTPDDVYAIAGFEWG